MSPYINPESLSHNNSEKSSTAEINELTPSGYSLFMHCVFNTTENKLDCYGGKDCMGNFYLDLRKHVAKINNYGKKKEMIALTNKEKKFL